MLIMVLLTLTSLTLSCSTSLYVTSQDANATTQPTSWQQAMAGAEAAVHQAMSALNTGTWTGWYTITGSSLPTAKPSPSGTPFPSGGGGMPVAGQYNYYSSSFPLQGEASNSVSMWVTVDNGSLAPTTSGLTNNGAQAYRIRATATVSAPGPKRVSNNKLDNDLRHISIMFNRLTGTATGSHGQAARRIELVAVPVAQSLWGRAITLKNEITMSGGGYVDSFDSSNPFKSNNSQYDPTKRQTNGDIGLTNTKNGNNYSNLNSTYVYGSIQYSGPAIQNATHVQGGISTPFNATIPATVDPTTLAWAQTNNLPQYSSSQQANSNLTFLNSAANPYTSYTTSGGNAPTTTPALTFTAASTSNSASSPTLIKVNGNFTLSGSNTFNVKPPSSGSGPYYVIIWVTGQFNTSGSSQIIQDPNVKVTWIVDGNITVSGSSYNNQSGLAVNTSFIGVGTGHTVTDSGNGNFIGTLNAPGYDITISGQGAFLGAAIGNTINISGSGGFHYDEHLASANGPVANYAYASWFEDNSDPARGLIY